MSSLLQKLSATPTYLNLFAALLILLPVHAVLVTIFSASEFNTVLIRSWKEIFLIGLVVASLPFAYRQKAWRDPVIVLFGIYAALHLVYVFFFWDGFSSLVGLRNNLGFLMIYVVGMLHSNRHYGNIICRIIIVLGGFVAASALLQFVLPENWFDFALIGVGGDVSMIQDSEIARLHGVLSGPLQLGSYLILPLALVQQYYRLHRSRVIIYTAVLVSAIFFTYSRAALLAAVGVIVLSWLLNRKTITKNMIIKVLAVGTIAFAGILIIALQWRPLSLLVFHAEPEKALTESSTADHFEYSYEAAQELVEDPLGDGPGSAGPASAFAQKTVLPENYFLQIGLEVGVAGLLLVVAIMILAASRLWPGNAPLLVSFLALTGMNLLLHTWTDTATAWTWWLLAGLASGLKPDGMRQLFARHTSATKIS